MFVVCIKDLRDHHNATMWIVLTLITACLIDLGLVVDESGSIRDTNLPGQDNWQDMIRFLSDIINRLDIGLDATRVGLVTFGNRYVRTVGMTAIDADDMMQNIENNIYTSTSTMYAKRVAMNNCSFASDVFWKYDEMSLNFRGTLHFDLDDIGNRNDMSRRILELGYRGGE